MRINRYRKRRLAKYMRRHPTKHESILRRALYAGCGGVPFGSQVILHGWIADFYAPSARLLVEVDGKSHTSPSGRARDALRDRVLASYGYRTLRFTNQEVLHELPKVIKAIAEVAEERNRIYGPSKE